MENRDLIFNWNLGGETLKENVEFRYKFDVNNLEIVNYITEFHSLNSMCEYNELKEKIGANESLEHWLISVLDFDDLFYNTVLYLKETFSSFYDFDMFYEDSKNYFLEEPQRSNESLQSHFLGNLYDRVEVFTRKVSDAPFMAVYVDDLNNAIDFFDRKKDPSLIESWINSTRTSIQEKADALVETMKNVVADTSFSRFESELDNVGKIVGIESKIKKKREKVCEAIDALSTIVDGCKKYLKKGGKYQKRGGCYALCIVDGKKVYSLSGVEDYNGSWNVNFGRKKEEILDLNGLISFFSQNGSFEYAGLLDSTLCYIHKRFSRCLEKEKTLYQVFCDQEYNYQDFTCCERKILSHYVNATNFRFYIRKEPCKLCQPAMISNDMRNIVTYVYEDGTLKSLKVVSTGDSFNENRIEYM